jgi:hypothetical protein
MLDERRSSGSKIWAPSGTAHLDQNESDRCEDEEVKDPYCSDLLRLSEAHIPCSHLISASGSHSPYPRTKR